MSLEVTSEDLRPVVLAKLITVAAMLRWPAAAPGLFWLLLGVSAVSAHAPKSWRHWRPAFARAPSGVTSGVTSGPWVGR